MDGEDRRGWRHQLREAFRPDPRPGPLSKRSRRYDLALAVLLTAVALIVAARFPGDGPIGGSSKVSVGVSERPLPTAPAVPEVPTPPVPPPLPSPPAAPEVPRPPVPDIRVVSDGERVAPWPLVVLSALPLFARRRYPLAVFGVVAVAALGIGDRASWINVLTLVVGAYSAVMYSRHRAGAMGALVVAAVLTGFAFRDTEPVLPGWSSPAVVLLIAGVLSGVVRFGRRRMAAGRERFARLEREQQEATRRAVAEERARIAAELHDVVTHNVSVMVIQAGAARKVMDVAPERSKEALLAVEAGGRAAMAELRHVMGLLAAPDPDQPEALEPQPGLARLDALIVRVRAAGTPVGIAVSLPPEPLPPGVDLTAYRVVQEALTNTIKHAPGAEAAVTIGYTDDRLEIEVLDTGAVRDAVPVDGNGRGLIGLRERLAVYDGELTAGPTLAGGYRIRADIPWRSA